MYFKLAVGAKHDWYTNKKTLLPKGYMEARTWLLISETKEARAGNFSNFSGKLGNRSSPWGMEIDIVRRRELYNPSPSASSKFSAVTCFCLLTDFPREGLGWICHEVWGILQQCLSKSFNWFDGLLPLHKALCLYPSLKYNSLTISGRVFWCGYVEKHDGEQPKSQS